MDEYDIPEIPNPPHLIGVPTEANPQPSWAWAQLLAIINGVFNILHAFLGLFRARSIDARAEANRALVTFQQMGLVIEQMKNEMASLKEVIQDKDINITGTTGTGEATHRLKTNPPEVFNGDPTKCDRFLLDVAQNLSFAKVNDFKKQIQFAFTYIRGDKVSTWADQQMKLIEEHLTDNTKLFPYANYNDFRTDLLTRFGDRHKTETAQRDLMVLKQGKKTVEQFRAEFEALALVAKFDQSYLLWLWKDRLSTDLRKAIEARGNSQNLSLDEWKREAVELDYLWNVNKPATTTTSSFIPKPSSSDTSHAAQFGSTTKDSNAMEIDGTRKRKPGSATGIKCFRCAQIGHYAKNCPSQRNKSINATEMLPHFSDDELKLMAEELRKKGF